MTPRVHAPSPKPVRYGVDTIPVPAALVSRADWIKSLDVAAQSTKFVSASRAPKVAFPAVRHLIRKFPEGVITRRDIFALGDLARRRCRGPASASNRNNDVGIWV
jgi:hypothetical protein